MASDPKPPSIGESLSAQPSRTIFISKDLRDPLHVLRCGLAAYMPKGSLPTYSDLFLLLIEAAPHLVERLFVGAAIAGDNADVAISNARENLAQLVRKARRVSTPLTQAHPPAGQSTVFHPGQFQSFPGQLPGSSSRSNPYFNFVPGQVPGSSNSNPYFNFTRGQVPGSSNSSNPYFNFMPGQVPGNSNSNPYYNVAPGAQQKAAPRRGRASRRKKTGASIEDDESDGYQPVTFRLPNVLEIMAVDPAAVDGLDFSKSKIESSSKFGWGGPRRGCNYEELAAREDPSEQPSANVGRKRKSRRAVGSAGLENPGMENAGADNSASENTASENTGPGHTDLESTGLGDSGLGDHQSGSPGLASGQDVPIGYVEPTAAENGPVDERENVQDGGWDTVPVPVELVIDVSEPSL